MTDIAKARKIRHQVNFNYDMGSIPSKPEKPAALLESPGDVTGATETKRRKKGKKAPQHAQAEGFQGEMAKPEVDKSIERVGTPFGDRRVSGPVLEGHQKPSTGDHGAGHGRHPNVAYRHPDLQEQPEDSMRARVRAFRTSDPNWMVGASSQFGYTDRPKGAPGETVTVRVLDLRNSAGSFEGVREPVGSHCERELDHPARTSATPDNGGHSAASQHGAASRNPYSSKSIKDIMRDNAVEAIRNAGR